MHRTASPRAEPMAPIYAVQTGSASAAAHDPEQYQEDDGHKRRRDEVGSGRYGEDAEPRQDEAPMSAPRMLITMLPTRPKPCHPRNDIRPRPIGRSTRSKVS